MEPNTNTHNPFSELEQLRARVLELETRQAQDARTFEERVIAQASALVQTRDEKLAIVEEEKRRAETKQVLRRPSTWAEFAVLTSAEKSELVSLYGNGFISECLSDKTRRDRVAREEEMARRAAASRPRYE